MGNILRITISIFNAALMVYTFTMFFGTFAKHKLAKRWHFATTLLVIICFSCILLLTKNRVLNVILLLGLTYALSQLYAFKWHNGLLFSILAYCLGTLSEIIAALTLSLLFGVDLKTSATGGYYVLGVLLSKVITVLIILLIRMKKQYHLYGTSIKKKMIILLIPLSTLIMLVLQYYYFMSLPENHMLLPATFCYIFLIGTNIVVIDLLEHLYRDAEKDNMLSLSQKMIEFQAAQYQQVLSNNQQVLNLQHDFKNILIGLTNLAQSNDKNEMSIEIQKLLDKYTPTNRSMFPPGIIGDIISIKSENASTEGITIDFTCPNLLDIKIPEMDLAVMLGNALDNAIEATSICPMAVKKVISLQIIIRNQQIIFLIKNPVQANVDVTDLKTTKNGPASHGLGIPSIKSIAEKYEGDVFFQCDNLFFETRIILRNKR